MPATDPTIRPTNPGHPPSQSPKAPANCLIFSNMPESE